MANLYNGIFNNYSIKPKNMTQYTSFRGVTDFTQIGAFNQFETGYSFLSIISMPPYLTKIAENNAEFKVMLDSWKSVLENEFRGLDGLPDMQADTYEITDGINAMRMINKVTFDTAATVSSNYFEKSGGLHTKMAEFYLTGIKDRITQAKTYHGLIKAGLMEPNLENEVFTMLYFVTDSTKLRLERAVLLCNAQLTKADTSIYNGQRDDINNKELTLEWNCFPVMGYEVDKAAKTLLEDITGVSVTTANGTTTYTDNTATKENVAVLDSNEYKYGIMDEKSNAKIDTLVKAVEGEA